MRSIFGLVHLNIALFSLSSHLSNLLQDIEKGIHDDSWSRECDEYRKEYRYRYGQEHPGCQFKYDKSKIPKLIRKAHIDFLSSEMLSKMENLAINLCDAKTEINELKATLKKLKPESQDMSTQTHNLAD